MADAAMGARSMGGARKGSTKAGNSAQASRLLVARLRATRKLSVSLSLWYTGLLRARGHQQAAREQGGVEFPSSGAASSCGASNSMSEHVPQSPAPLLGGLAALAFERTGAVLASEREHAVPVSVLRSLAIAG